MTEKEQTKLIIVLGEERINMLKNLLDQVGKTKASKEDLPGKDCPEEVKLNQG